MPAASTPDHRLLWPDCCKGICIILVVYGHVCGGLTAASIVPAGSAADILRSWVYLFHMPAFFFLSGLFASRALKKPFATFISNRFKTLAYPYVLWTGIYLLVQTAMSRFVNNPPDAGRAADFLWQPYGYGLWFLYSLFLISLLFYLLQMARLPKPIILGIAIALSLAAYFNLFAFWPILNQAFSYFLYYAIGGLYAETVFVSLIRENQAIWWIAGALFLAAMTALAFTLSYPQFLIAWGAAFLGIAGVVSLSRAVSTNALATFFAPLGFYSLEIYLAHPLFSTATRALLTHSGIQSEYPILLTCVVAGVGLSFLLGLLGRKYNFPYLFRWPSAPPA